MRKIIGWAVVMILVSVWSFSARAQAYGSAGYAAPALSTTVATVKASKAQLAFVHCYNPNASAAFVQFFDTAGAVTLGTTPPKVFIGIPATQSVSVPVGIEFVNALKAAASTTPNGNTALGSALNCSFGFQ